MQDVTIPKAGSNANSATRILLFIIAVHYHTARPQGKPVRREASGRISGPYTAGCNRNASGRSSDSSPLRSLPGPKASGIRFGTFRFFSATRAEKKPRHTAAVTVADSHGVPSFVSRTVRPSGSSLDTFAKIANISEQSTPKSKNSPDEEPIRPRWESPQPLPYAPESRERLASRTAKAALPNAIPR